MAKFVNNKSITNKKQTKIKANTARESYQTKHKSSIEINSWEPKTKNASTSVNTFELETYRKLNNTTLSNNSQSSL